MLVANIPVLITVLPKSYWNGYWHSINPYQYGPAGTTFGKQWPIQFSFDMQPRIRIIFGTLWKKEDLPHFVI
jgi:hypothetical protein